MNYSNNYYLMKITKNIYNIFLIVNYLKESLKNLKLDFVERIMKNKFAMIC